MALEITYKSGGVGILITGQGCVVGKDICAALNEMYSGEFLLKQKYQIWDFQSVDHFDFPRSDFDEMVRLDTMASRQNPNILVAIVGEEDLIYGISRMWEAHMDMQNTGFETMTFRNKKDADDWIANKLAAKI